MEFLIAGTICAVLLMAFMLYWDMRPPYDDLGGCVYTFAMLVFLVLWIGLWTLGLFSG